MGDWLTEKLPTWFFMGLLRLAIIFRSSAFKHGIFLGLFLFALAFHWASEIGDKEVAVVIMVSFMRACLVMFPLFWAVSIAFAMLDALLQERADKDKSAA